MSEWQDEIEHDPERLEAKVGKAVNMLTPYPGPEDLKRRILRQVIPLAEEDAATEHDPERDRKRYNAKVRSLVIRYYRTAYRRERAREQVGDPRSGYGRTSPRPRREGFEPASGGIRGVVSDLDPAKRGAS